MGTYVQNLLKKSEYKSLFQDTQNPFLKTLPIGTIIHRSGKDELIITRETRKKAASVQLNPRYRTPLFFSSKHIAALYGEPNASLYIYQLQRQMTILPITKEFCTFLWNNLANDTEKKAIKEWFFLLGFNPYRIEKTKNAMNVDEDKDLVEQWDDEMMKFIQAVVEKDPSLLFLHESYTKTTFTRVSQTDADRTIFSNVITMVYQTPVLKELFQAADALYFYPMASGCFNKYNFLSQFDEFHEEFFVRESIVKGYEIRVISDKQFPEFSLDAFRSVSYGTPDPLESQSDVSNYIYTFQQAYTKGATAVLDSIQHCKLVAERLADQPITTYPYHEWATSFLNTYTSSLSDVLLNVYNFLVNSFILNAKHFQYLPDENPFVKDGQFQEELYLFTCCSDFCKASVREFDRFLETMSLSVFRPIASGGILFGVYTFGPYKRLTKDIDLKIIQTDTFANREEMELSHFHLSFAIHIWSSIVASAGTYMSKPLITYASEIYPYPDCKVYGTTNAKYETYIGYSPTYLKQLDQSVQIFLLKHSTIYKEKEDSSPKKNLFIQAWDAYIKTFMKEHPTEEFRIDDLVFEHSALGFQEFRSALLKHRKQVKDKNIERFINVKRALKVTTQFFLQFCKTIQPTLFPDVSIQDVSSFVLEYLPFILQRPSVHENETVDYKIGYFASLWISCMLPKKPQRNYGIIDYTYDTNYACEGTIQFQSGIKANTTIQSEGLPVASFLHFVDESYKLVQICSANYYLDNETTTYNPYNRCAPALDNRRIKYKKYLERYSLVADFLRKQILPILTIQKHVNTMKDVTDTIRTLIVEKRLIRIGTQEVPMTEKTISLWIVQEMMKRRANEPMIGASYKRYRGKTHKRFSKYTRQKSLKRTK